MTNSSRSILCGCCVWSSEYEGMPALVKQQKIKEAPELASEERRKAITLLVVSMLCVATIIGVGIYYASPYMNPATTFSSVPNGFWGWFSAATAAAILGVAVIGFQTKKCIHKGNIRDILNDTTRSNTWLLKIKKCTDPRELPTEFTPADLERFGWMSETSATAMMEERETFIQTKRAFDSELSKCMPAIALLMKEDSMRQFQPVDGKNVKITTEFLAAAQKLPDFVPSLTKLSTLHGTLIQANDTFKTNHATRIKELPVSLSNEA